MRDSLVVNNCSHTSWCFHVRFSNSSHMLHVFHILTVVDCGALTNPANGQVSYPTGTTFGQTATYSCDTGYNLVGDSIRMCQPTGVWSGSEPTCLRMLLPCMQSGQCCLFNRGPTFRMCMHMYMMHSVRTCCVAHFNSCGL